MDRSRRLKLLREIEKKRNSKVLAYICSDRQNATAQIADDAVRPMYDLVRTIGKVSHIDVLIYSRGGAVEVPWRIITMLREYCDKLGAIIPYKAHSAATLISIGCDEIVMGSKAELGPIDPALTEITNEGGTPVKNEIRVEDVMAYIDFIRTKAGLGDQNALAQNVGILTNKLSPWVVGQIYRTHSHIRTVARKLLGSHTKNLDEQRINLIIEALSEKVHSHGHAIGRKEAMELGLPITSPDEDLDNLMWNLLEQYEDLMEIRDPFDADIILGKGRDEVDYQILMALIESESDTWAFRMMSHLKRIRQTPPQVQVSINFNVSLPQGIDQSHVPQEITNQLQQQIKQNVPDLVNEQVKKQSSVIRIDGRFFGGRWEKVTNAGI